MIIRHAKPADAEAVLNIYRPYIEYTAITFETTVPTLDEFSGRMKTITEKYPWLIAEDEGKVTGYAYASKHRDREAYQWSVECSVYVLEEYHGKGIAKELYLQLFNILKKNGYVNVYAGITLPNPASESFHSRMGFEPLGIYKKIGYKMGKWHDVAWLSKSINDHCIDPAVPRKEEII